MKSNLRSFAFAFAVFLVTATVVYDTIRPRPKYAPLQFVQEKQSLEKHRNFEKIFKDSQLLEPYRASDNQSLIWYILGISHGNYKNLTVINQCEEEVDLVLAFEEDGLGVFYIHEAWSLKPEQSLEMQRSLKEFSRIRPVQGSVSIYAFTQSGLLWKSNNPVYVAEDSLEDFMGFRQKRSNASDYRQVKNNKNEILLASYIETDSTPGSSIATMSLSCKA